MASSDPHATSTLNPGAFSDEEVVGIYEMLDAERRLRGLGRSATLWPPAKDALALMFDRAIRAIRAKNQALETIQRELDLPEHLAEIVGNALAKDAGRSK